MLTSPLVEQALLDIADCTRQLKNTVAEPNRSILKKRLQGAHDIVDAHHDKTFNVSRETSVTEQAVSRETFTLNRTFNRSPRHWR